MNVLLTAGPESTTLFTITVQASGRPARLAGQRHVTVPLNRLQPTYRRLLLAGDTILSVTRCQHMGDPPPSPHPVPTVYQVQEATRPTLVEQPPKQSRQGQTGEFSIGDDVIVLLLSALGVVILLTLQVVQHLAQRLAQQWEMRSQPQQRLDPRRLDRSVVDNTAPLIKMSQHLGCGSDF